MRVWGGREQPEGYPFATVTKGMSGYFAIIVWWAEGFAEPWDKGIGRYATFAAAEEEAKAWADNEGILYKEPANA